MADNVTTPIADGSVLAADDVAGIIYPRTKLSHGVDGAAVDVSTAAPLPVDGGNVITLADGVKIAQIGTTSKKFSDNFGVFDTNKWSVVRQTGFTYAITSGELVITTTATSADELLLVGKQGFTNPANLLTIFRMAARNAAQEVRMGFVEVDSNGDPVPHASIAGQFANTVYMVAGRITTATTGYLESFANSSAVRTLTGSTLTTTAANVEFALELRPEDAVFATAIADSSTARVTTAVRLSSQLPDPNKLYRPFIWLINTGAAAATTVTFTRILAMDIQELQAEVGGGRGNALAAQALPVIQVATPSGTTTASISNFVGATTSNGLTNFRRLSTADNNLVNIKATAGKIVGGVISNTGAGVAFVKFYAKTTAPVLASDTPIFTIMVPPNGMVNLANVFGVFGANIATGISMSITGAYADTDTTAVTAGQVIVNLTYI